MSDRARIILTAVGTPITPAAGDLMAGPKERSPHYRILGVIALRQAGKRFPMRYRLTCQAVPRTPGATVLPWRLAVPQRPPSRAAEPVGLVPPRAIVSAEVRERAVQAAAEQRARARRVGRDRGIVDGRDRGHPIRLEAVISERGQVLRQADVVIEEARDHENPKRRVIRARRVDPAHLLFRAGSICKRQYDALEAFRSRLEAGVPGAAGASYSEVHASPWSRVGISDRRMRALGAVRSVLELMPAEERGALVWIAVGGTVDGYQRYEHVHNHTARARLCAALDLVADHYFGEGCYEKTCCRCR